MTKTKDQAFEDLSPAKQRVAIARDVLKQLREKKIVAQRGVYFTSADAFLNSTYVPPDAQVRDLLLPAKECQVCALGACFMATVKKLDRLTVRDFTESDTGVNGFTYRMTAGRMSKYLQKLFSIEQLIKIELAFEGETSMSRWDHAHSRYVQVTSPSCRRFNEGVESDRRKMERIMRNIVDNGGTFFPGQRTKKGR